MTTHVVPTIDEERVRSAIDARIENLSLRMNHAIDEGEILGCGIAIDALIELESDLGLDQKHEP